MNVYGGEKLQAVILEGGREETEIESERTKGKMGKEMKGRGGKLCNNPRSFLYHNHSAVRQSARRGRVRVRVDGQTRVPSASNKILQKP